MAILAGYQPALQPELGKTFSLPFNELYTAMKGRQDSYDLAQSQADAMYASLGSVQGLRPEDMLIHQQKMKDIFSKEEQLRSSVGDDLSNPQYKSELRKMILGVATDPFYSVAKGNADAYYNQYLPAYQQAVGTQGAVEDWQKLGKNLDNYKGAVNPDGTFNESTFEGILPYGNLSGQAAKVAKEIIPLTWGNLKYDNALGVYVNEKGVKVTKQEIVDVLKKNIPAFKETPDYRSALTRYMHDNPGSDEKAFIENYFTPMAKGIADIYDRNDLETSYAYGYDNTGNTTRRNSGGDDDEIPLGDILQVGVTAGDRSIANASPEVNDKYINTIDRLLTKNPAPADMEKNIWTRTSSTGKDGGLNELATKLKEATGGEVSIEPTYHGYGVDNEDDRLTFDITITQTDGTKKVLTPDDQEYKDNAVHIGNLQAEYEFAAHAKDRAQEFDNQARAETGYNETNFKFTQADIQKEVDARLKKDSGLGLFFLSTLSGKPIDESLKKLYQTKKEIITQKVEDEFFQKDPQYQNYKNYKKFYKDNYGEGYYQTTQFAGTFGVEAGDKAFVDQTLNLLSNKLQARDLEAFDPKTGEAFDNKQYEDLAKLIESKAEEDKIKLQSISWRLDYDDGIVIDYNVAGTTVEVRDLDGVMRHLGIANLQDYQVLTLMNDTIKKSKKNTFGVEGVGEGGDYGFIGGTPDFPRMYYQRNATPIERNGITYSVGSYELKVPAPTEKNPNATRSEYYNNIYDMHVEGYLKNMGTIQTQQGTELLNKIIGFESNGKPGLTSAYNPGVGYAVGVGQVLPATIDSYNFDNKTNYSINEVRDDALIGRQVANWYLNTKIPERLRNSNVPVNDITKTISYFAGPGSAAAWYSISNGQMTPESIEYLKSKKDVNGTTIYDYLENVKLI